MSRSSIKEEGKTHKGKIPPSNEGAYKTIAKAAKNGMTRHAGRVVLPPRPSSSVLLPPLNAGDGAFVLGGTVFEGARR